MRGFQRLVAIELFLGLFCLAWLVVADPSMCHGHDGWVVSFEDEFEHPELNQSNWVVFNNRTHGDVEKQLYMADEVQIENGSLVLTSRKQAVPLWSGKQSYNFTSGWVQSSGKRYQQFGRFEVRAKLPDPGAGRTGMWPVAWPAHWLMPEPTTSSPPNVCWPVGGEIDIMEGFYPRGGDNRPDHTSIYMTYHWAKECGKDLYDGKNEMFPPKASKRVPVDWTQFHTFTIEWNVTSITWFVDGTQHHQRVAGDPASLFIPQWPFYMILNTAIEPFDIQDGADSGFPIRHEIDRVTFCEKQQVDGGV
jgi:beta-glucanase (GH16 family)